MLGEEFFLTRFDKQKLDLYAKGPSQKRGAFYNWRYGSNGKARGCQVVLFGFSNSPGKLSGVNRPAGNGSSFNS